MSYSWYSGGKHAVYDYLDLWAREMSWMRISSIRLGYTLPESAAKKLHIDQLRLSIEGRNSFVFGSDYEGYFDPETYGNPFVQPISRSISLGLQVLF